MARTLVIDEPTAADDGKVLHWDHTRQVADLVTAVKPAGATMTGDITFPNGVGIVLTATDGTKWRITVGTTGTLATVSVP